MIDAEGVIILYLVAANLQIKTTGNLQKLVKIFHKINFRLLYLYQIRIPHSRSTISFLTKGNRYAVQYPVALL